uniref:NADH-ubiquinone oxidoreductase chain 2 n=1 Tax=Muda kuroiwae TaxID=2170272 RepID=A0A344ALU3_9HEMI|nr:NADH dehydrogenase subunit 2 [Muda kuroiwae]
MKKNSSFLLFITFIILGIMISVSSNNWLGCWMGIEINMVSFLPFMLNKMSIYSSESMISYFIVQGMSSSLLFLSVIMLGMYSYMNYFVIISLMIKMGCPPFHFWYISVIEGLQWMICFMLMSIQKIIPMILLSYLMMNIHFFIILSCIWGSIGGLCYSSMRSILGYSSIYNLSWIFSGILTMNYSWMMYFIIYSINLFMMCYFFNLMNINYMNQFFMCSDNMVKSLFLMVNFLSIGGIPPFLGFFPKLIIIYFMLQSDNIIVCLIMVMFALIVLFFYLRLVLTGLMINFTSMKLIVNNWMLNVFYLFGNFSLFGLFFIVLTYYMN